MNVLFRSHLLRLAAIITIGLVLSSCVRYQFMRRYQVSGPITNYDRDDIEEFFQAYFIKNGLKLKRKYQQLYFWDIKYLVFELPEPEQQKEREFQLIISITDDLFINIEQKEWFSDPTKPRDFIENVKDDLEAKLKSKFGPDIGISFVEKVGC